MKQEILLSIIVPVYNVGSYLEKCINSILNQTYKNIEIVLIDDGSTDNSGNICDEYARQDMRIRVYHQENRGLVFSRKKGVKLVTGDLITFVDSDDWIEEDMYASMMDVYLKENVDLVSSGIYYDYVEENKPLFQELDLLDEGYYNKEEIKRKVLPIMMWNNQYSRRGITSTVCNKIFKKELLKEVLFELDDRITLGEDAAITYLYIARANNMAVINKSWYHYVIRLNSMVRSCDMSIFEKIKIFKSFFLSECQKLGTLDVFAYQLDRYVCSFLREAITNIYEVEFEKIRYVFPYELVPKGSRIILYGAGMVGRSYWNCIQRGTYVEVVSWVDKKYGQKIENQVFVEAPQVIVEKEFDYIVIAVESEMVAKEIKSELLELGIMGEKLLWKYPQILL